MTSLVLLYLAVAAHPSPANAQAVPMRPAVYPAPPIGVPTASFSLAENHFLTQRSRNIPNPTTAVEVLSEFYASAIARGLSGADPSAAGQAEMAKASLAASTDGWVLERTGAILIEAGKRGGAPSVVRIDWTAYPHLSSAVAFGVQLMKRAQQFGEGGGGLLPATPVQPAANARYACEAPPELDQFYLRQAKSSPDRVKLLRQALASDPNNIYLNRWLVVTDGLDVRAEYKKKMNEHPNDPSFLFDYAQALMMVGPDWSVAMPYLEKSVSIAPDFPWSYLPLEHLHSIGRFADQSALVSDMTTLTNLCPQQIDFSQISRVHDAEPLRFLAARYRAAIAQHLTVGIVAAYPSLWSNELRLTPAENYRSYASQIEADLAHLRSIGSTDPNALSVGEALVAELRQ